MRLIKLSDKEFRDIKSLEEFFDKELWDRDPKGKFRLKKQIREDGLKLGEIVLFSYKNYLRYVARVKFGRQKNTDDRAKEFPYYFTIDMDTVRPANIKINAVEKALQDKGALPATKTLKNQGWTIIEDCGSHDQKAIEVISFLIPDFEPQLSLRPEDAEAEDVEPYNPKDLDLRKVAERQIKSRRGSKQFRNNLRNRYGDCCLISGCKILDILEAAHICPYRSDNDNHPANGLLLRADIHTLFDLDLLGIVPDQLKVEIHPNIASEYGQFEGKSLNCKMERMPSREALQKRYKQFRLRLGKANS